MSVCGWSCRAFIGADPSVCGDSLHDERWPGEFELLTCAYPVAVDAWDEADTDGSGEGFYARQDAWVAARNAAPRCATGREMVSRTAASERSDR